MQGPPFFLGMRILRLVSAWAAQHPLYETIVDPGAPNGHFETFDAAAYFVDNRESERPTICEAADGQRVEHSCDVSLP